MNKNLYLNCFFIFFSISCLSASNIILNPSFQFDYVSTDIDASSDSIGSFNGTILNISSDDDKPDIIKAFILKNNYPNPFNPFTKINYYLFKEGPINIYIHDINGNRIIEHNIGVQPPGQGSFLWHAKNNTRHKIPSGIYFYTLEVDGERRTKSMVLIK